MLTPSLFAWIAIGLGLNFLFFKTDPDLQDENVYSTAFIIGIRSFSGGVISNYLFSFTQGVDLAQVLLFSLIPAAFLLLAKYYKLA